MKMKNLIVLSLWLTTAGCTLAQQTMFQTKTWNATVKVVGEDRQPISGANVVVGYVLPPYSYSDDPEYNARAEGKTDTNGLFFASHNDRTGGIGITADKVGYYGTRWSQTLRDPEENANDRNISTTLVLKKIGKPIAMYAKLVDENPPTLGQSIGYDLMMGDWVCGGHKGVNADIFFQKWAYRKSGADYEYKVKITFPKTGDGIQIYTIPDLEKGSGLRSPHEAPLEGYQPELNKERSAHPGQPTKNDDDPNRIYLFRVRTVIDARGNIVSALYGKIYGDFMQFTYYLNPTPNDRNIEFDLKRNLLGGLQSFERVTAP